MEPSSNRDRNDHQSGNSISQAATAGLSSLLPGTHQELIVLPHAAETGFPYTPEDSNFQSLRTGMKASLSAVSNQSYHLTQEKRKQKATEV